MLPNKEREMKPAKTLKKCLGIESESESESESETEYDYENEVEIVSVANGYGHWLDSDCERCDRYVFFRRDMKIYVKKMCKGSFRCCVLPWKGERPEEMSFEYYRL